MLTLDMVADIVRLGAWAKLKGEAEGRFFDCKRAPLKIVDDVGRLALAKDVAAFANSGGGFLLFGFETEKCLTRAVETVSDFRPFPEYQFHLQQYRDIIASWIHPVIDGLDLKWQAAEPGSSEGFGVIAVPTQAEVRKPFVIRKAIIEDKTAESLVCYVERRNDENAPASAETIASWLRDGRNYQSSVSQKLDAILAAMAGGLPSVAPRLDSVRTRIDDTLRAQDLAGRPHYVLAAHPFPDAVMRSFFATGTGSVAHMLEHPPILRSGGWDLASGDTARLVEGEFREVTGALHDIVRLYRDGLLIAAASAGSDFLGWGRKREEFAANPWLNVLAVTEWTYSFCGVFQRILDDLEPAATNASITIRLGRLQTGGTACPIFLVPGELGSFPIRSQLRSAPKDTFEKELSVPASAFRSEEVAYQLIREIFAWFGAEPSTIPYTSESNGRVVVDPEKIVNTGK